MRINSLINRLCGHKGGSIPRNLTINTDKVEITLGCTPASGRLHIERQDTGASALPQNKQQSTERYLIVNAVLSPTNSDIVRFEFKQEKDGYTYVEYIERHSPLYDQLFRAVGKKNLYFNSFGHLVGEHVWIQREETKITFLRDFNGTPTVDADLSGEPKWHRCVLKHVKEQTPVRVDPRFVTLTFEGIDAPLTASETVLLASVQILHLLAVCGKHLTLMGKDTSDFRLNLLREAFGTMVWLRRRADGQVQLKKYSAEDVCPDFVPKHTHGERKQTVTILSVEKAKKEGCLIIACEVADGQLGYRQYVRIPTFGDSAKSLVLAVDTDIKTTMEDSGVRISDHRLDFLKRLAVGKRLTLIDCPCGNAEVRFERLVVETVQTAKQTLAAAKDGPLRTGKYNARIVSAWEENRTTPFSFAVTKVLKIRYAIRDGEYKGRTIVQEYTDIARITIHGILEFYFSDGKPLRFSHDSASAACVGKDVTILVNTTNNGREVKCVVEAVKLPEPIIENKTEKLDDHRFDAVRYMLGNGVDGRILCDGKSIGRFTDIEVDYHALAEKFAKSPNIQYRPKAKFAVGDKVVRGEESRFRTVNRVAWDSINERWRYAFEEDYAQAYEKDIKHYVPEPPATMMPEELLDGWRFPIGAKLQGRVNSERKCVCCGGKIHLSDTNVVWPHTSTELKTPRNGAPSYPETSTEHLYAHPMCLFKKTLGACATSFKSLEWSKDAVKDITKRDKFRAQQKGK